jgi:thiol-disulfide isomerase/thioredoxin
MTFTAAALALAWIAIALLGFGFAALLQQVRSLQAAMRLPPAARAGVVESARQLAPTSSDRRFVLTVDPGCVYCHEIAPRFRDIAQRYADVADFAILASEGQFESSPAVAVFVDATAYRELAPSWSPGLLLVGPGGILLDVAPGGDMDALEKVLNGSKQPATKKTATEVTP